MVLVVWLFAFEGVEGSTSSSIISGIGGGSYKVYDDEIVNQHIVRNNRWSISGCSSASNQSSNENSILLYTKNAFI